MVVRNNKEGLQQKVNRDALLDLKEEVLVVALSGGVDSMTLADFLFSLSLPQTIILAHFDHHLRPTSTKQANEIVAYWQERGQQVIVGEWETPSPGEQGAREARYEFLTQIAKEKHAALVTAHHLDDQVETFFLKLFRKSSLKGLSGMPHMSIDLGVPIIRPFRDIPKKQLEEYAKQQHLPIWEDETNNDTIYARNWVRNSLLPVITERFQQAPQSVTTVMGDIEAAEQIVRPIMANIIQKSCLFHPISVEQKETGARAIEIDTNVITELSVYEERLFWQALADEAQTRYGIDLSRKQTQAISQLIRSKTTAQGTLSLNGRWQVIKRYEIVVFELLPCSKSTGNSTGNLNSKVTSSKVSGNAIEKELKPQQTATKSFDIAAQQEGFARVDCQSFGSYNLTGNLSVKITRLSLNSRPTKGMIETQLIYPNDLINWPLTVRHRKPGDQLFFQAKKSFHQKVNRWFINHKISNEVRDEAWLVVDSDANVIGILDHLNTVDPTLGERDYIAISLVKTESSENEASH